MALGLGWKLYGDGSAPPQGEVVKPDERLSWGRTVGLGAQHVVAMFGATFVFPLIMGLDPNLAIMMSGICTILFLLIVQGKVPSYLGTSASFVGAVVVIREVQGGSSGTVVGAILVAGLVLAAVGVLIHYLGAEVIHRVLPPVVTGAVVMLIGFNLAPVVATVYWPQDQWIAIITMLAMLLMTVLIKGFWGRVAIFLALVFGYALSWVFDRVFGQITSATRCRGGHHPLAGQLRPISGHARLVRPAAPHHPGLQGLGDPRHAARGHRADRGEHRAREGRRGDDPDQPRRQHGQGARSLTVSAPRWPRRSVVRRRRRTPRTSASWRRRGSTRPRPTTSRHWWRSCSACARSSGRSSPPHQAVCSAASRWSCTA